MMAEWMKVELGEVCELLDCLHMTPKYSKTGYPMVRVTDVKDGYLDTTNCLRVNKDVFRAFSKGYTPKIGDIVFTRVGTYGLSGLVREPTYFCLGQNTSLILSIGINPFFLFYYLISEDAKFQIGGLAGGSTQPTISMANMRKIEIPFPAQQMQIQIAEVLSSLDDKIDLLHRQNQTLEAMAETLFRQWFVEEAEEGWEELRLIDAIKLVGGGTPKTSIPEYWVGNIKWLSGGDISNNHRSFIIDTEKKISEAGLNDSSAKFIPKHSTVISARGTVGKYCLLSEPMTFSQSNYGILPIVGECYFFTYLLIGHSISELKAAAYGSVFDTITTDTFREHRIQLPKEPTIKEFESLIKPLFDKMLANSFQVVTLRTLRDLVLPKLMNGEVRVKMD